MKHRLDEIQKSLRQLQNGSSLETHILFPGMELSFLTLQSDSLSLRHHEADEVMEINYCRTGRMGWNMGNGNTVYLGPGDYALHSMKSCANSAITLPNGRYEGLVLCLDLNRLTLHPPQLLEGTGITGDLLYSRYCQNKASTSYAGNAESEQIFSGFFRQPEPLRAAYWKLKALELLLYLAKPESPSAGRLTEYQSEQAAVIRSIHDQLVNNLDQRFTIEFLSKQYLMNPTTLKDTFKAVYGNSIAAHVKSHRMEQAARLLLETGDSVAQVAKAVGYDNQSKFSEAFKESYQVLPTEYRKQHGKPISASLPAQF